LGGLELTPWEFRRLTPGELADMAEARRDLSTRKPTPPLSPQEAVKKLDAIRAHDR